MTTDATNAALRDLMALIETTDNDDVDTANDVLNNYPAVWNELFAFPRVEVEDAELTDQSIAAISVLRDALAGSR